MKKQLLFTICLLISGIAAQASHLMGGQMTSRNIGGLTYEVTLTAYRDTLGVPMYTTATINYNDTSVVPFASHIVPVSPAFAFGNGVERYTYVDTITFAASGTYNMWWEDCCRNGAILNTTNPGGESFHLANTILADSTNSSPVFLNEPITIAQLGVPFTYNPLPFDADGDSISWMLDVPLSSGGAVVSGYVLPSSDTLVPFTMDPVTGEITFLPNAVGYYVASMLVKEFRAGVQIGEIRRDMQIIVVASVNTPSPISLISTNAPFSGKNYTIEPGTAFNFTVVANDPDGYAINFSSNGEAYRLANPATFSSNATMGTATASLTWTPNASNERSRPYIIGLRLNEPYGIYNFASDISIYLRVQTSTGINNPANADTKFTIYPNPTSDYMMLNFSSKSNSNGLIEIRNLAGQIMKSYEAIKVVNGLNVIQLKDLNLNAGIYIVNLIQDGKTLGISKVNIR